MWLKSLDRRRGATMQDHALWMVSQQIAFQFFRGGNYSAPGIGIG